MITRPPDASALDTVWKILIIEDDKEDFIIARQMLKQAHGRRFDVQWAGSYEEGLAALAVTPYDAVLVDYDLGSHSGIDLIRVVNEQGYAAPLILFTGHGSYEVDVEAMQAGATLYLTKGETSALLLERAIRYAIEIKANITSTQQAERDMAEANEQLQQQAVELEIQAEELQTQTEELAAANQKLAYQAGLLDNISEAAISTDASFNILSWNPAAERIYGWRASEVLGRPAGLFLQTGYLDGTTRADVVRRALEDGFWKGEVTQQRKDGARFQVEASVTLLKDRAGAMTGVVTINRDITQQKQAEEALRESEARYRKLHENLRDAFGQVDMQGVIVDFNEQYCQMLGYTPEEMRRLTYQDITPARWHELEARIVREQILPRGYSDVYEKEYRRKDGSVFPVEMRTILSTDAAGRPATMWAFIRDITERKQTEEEIRQLLRSVEEEKARLQSVINNIPDEVWFVDATGELAIVNEQVIKAFGREILEGQEAREIAAGSEVYNGDGAARLPDDAPPLRALRGEKVINYEEIARVPSSGELRHRLVNAVPVRDEHGSLLGSVSIVRDITEQKQAEEALRESEERNRLLIRYAPTAIYEIDFSGPRFVSVNDAMCAMSGYSREELLQMSPFQLLEEDSARLFKERVQKSLAGGTVDNTVEYQVRVRDGRLLWAQLNVQIQMDHGQAIALVIAHDVTARKQAEARLQDYAEKLERSNRDLQEFAFVASHDLQEPLRKITAFGSAILANSENLSEQQQGYLARMRLASERMQKMIDGLLALSRVSTRDRPFEQVDLSKAAADVLSDLEMQVRRTGGCVELGSLSLIEGDPSQVRQLLQNLIGNALKYHKPDEAPLVKVSGGPISSSMVEIVVQDNGIGFDEKYAERIFQPFQRLVGHQAYEGAGMGLAIVKKIVERHNGEIRARSTPGEGSTFIVRLPVRQK